ncbi:MAG TPA: dihydrolipoamide acetyltransferase family protein [Candidatus Saccharimonadales bacterium]|nr:dihydrolipoamide acetyltransferase family protein [Candidatus Saccharimonadales bacterium]
MKELKFVDVGEGITEGQIRQWLVKDGANVKEDQAIVKVETDKAIVDAPAPISGIVRIKAGEGTTVRVGDTIAYIGTAEELSGISSSAPAQAEKPAQPQAGRTTSQQKKTEETLATPAVRKLARDLNVEISKITGTGHSGRIVENDVRMAAQQTQKKSSPIPKFSEVLEESHDEEIERVPLTQTRKAIARNMELSATIPRAAHMDLVNATKLFEIVKESKEKMQKKGIKLTFLPFIIKAAIDALKENPRFNSSYDHETSEIIVKKYYNIGIAAEGPDGLKVVVIKDVEKKSVAKIAKELQELAEKVKDQTISIEEMRDSTFTITNIGSLGGGFLSVPMINYPEVAILGVHLIRDMPIVEDGKIMPAKILPLSLAFDHRVVDGADAVTFVNSIKNYLEDPEFLEML